MKFTEEELKNDFILFAQVVWHYMDLPELTRIQKYIAEYMADSSRRDRLIQAYRGGGKSYWYILPWWPGNASDQPENPAREALLLFLVMEEG